MTEPTKVRDALQPFVDLLNAREARYKKRGGDLDVFPDTHPAFDVRAQDLPLGAWRAIRNASTSLSSANSGQAVAWPEGWKCRQEKSYFVVISPNNDGVMVDRTCGIMAHVFYDLAYTLCNPIPATSASQEADARDGIYVASRVKHADMWRGLRAMQRLPINSTWIDEAGEGETSDFSELWHRIESEVKRSKALLLYVERDDFPLKGALIECGIALAAGVPIFVYTNAELEGRTMRPLGSWILDSRVKLMPSLDAAIAAAREVG